MLLRESRIHEAPSWGLALRQLGVSLAGLLGAWATTTWLCHQWGPLGLVALLPAAGFLLRLFMIQHDCGHHSFVPNPRANDILGRSLGALTLTPYDYWRASHAVHHSAAGDLDRRGDGDILTLTVEEFVALSPRDRLRYRVYRNPLFLFLFGAPFLFLIYYRLPRRGQLSLRHYLLSTAGTNLAVASVVVAGGATLGWPQFGPVYIGTVWISSAIGVWMFYVQHQFEDTYWARTDDWDFFASALQGSSFLEMPRALNWFTGDIALHHIHHLNPRIPNYHLRRFLESQALLRDVRPLTLAQGLRATRLALWDHELRKLVPIRSARSSGYNSSSA